MKNTIEDVKSKTLEILSSTEKEDVSHITDEYLGKVDKYIEPEGDNDKEALASTYYGHDMAYVYSERYKKYGYAFSTGSKGATSRSCGSSYGYFLPHDKWDHDKVGECSSRDALLKFSKK